LFEWVGEIKILLDKLSFRGDRQKHPRETISFLEKPKVKIWRKAFVISQRGARMRRMLLLGLCLTVMVTGIGCSTIKGVGEDVGTVGGWLKKGSDNVREGR
jgi:predicted small secreted protein